jgi:hypothetical protein
MYSYTNKKENKFNRLADSRTWIFEDMNDQVERNGLEYLGLRFFLISKILLLFLRMRSDSYSAVPPHVIHNTETKHRIL